MNLTLNIPEGKPTTAPNAECRFRKEMERIEKKDQIKKMDLENSRYSKPNQKNCHFNTEIRDCDPVMIRTDEKHHPTMVPQEIG